MAGSSAGISGRRRPTRVLAEESLRARTRRLLLPGEDSPGCWPARRGGPRCSPPAPGRPADGRPPWRTALTRRPAAPSSPPARRGHPGRRGRAAARGGAVPDPDGAGRPVPAGGAVRRSRRLPLLPARPAPRHRPLRHRQRRAAGQRRGRAPRDPVHASRPDQVADGRGARRADARPRLDLLRRDRAAQPDDDRASAPSTPRRGWPPGRRAAASRSSAAAPASCWRRAAGSSCRSTTTCGRASSPDSTAVRLRLAPARRRPEGAADDAARRPGRAALPAGGDRPALRPVAARSRT